VGWVFFIIYTEIAKANEQWALSCSVAFNQEMGLWVLRQDKPTGEAGRRRALPIPLPAACKAEGDKKQLPRSPWETAFATSLFYVLVGAHFHGSPWYFTYLHGGPANTASPDVQHYITEHRRPLSRDIDK